MEKAIPQADIHSAVLQELRALEPIFHTRAFGDTPADFERRMAPDYWEVGASGRRHDRGFILRHLREHPPVDAAAAGWRCFDHALRSLGPETWLLTYALDQNGRLTHRATVWEKHPSGWRILYHQGTPTPDPGPGHE